MSRLFRHHIAPVMLFIDRVDAGRQLAKQLSSFRDKSETLVFGLPRGGVVVAAQVAEVLQAPLDVVICRKLGAPANPEFAIGALAERDEVVLNTNLIAHYNIDSGYLDETIKKEKITINKRILEYRQGRLLGDLTGNRAIIVDDGIATGYTMRAAIKAIKAKNAKEIIIGIPVAPGEVLSELLSEVDEVICLYTPEPFYAVGRFYQLFDQTSEEEVKKILFKFRKDVLKPK